MRRAFIPSQSVSISNMKWIAVAWVLLLTFVVRVEAGNLDADTISRSFQEASRYEKVQNYHDAIRTLLPVVQAAPELYAGHLRLGWLYYLQGKYSNSVAHYKMATQTSDGAIEPVIGVLLPLLGQGKYAAAEQHAYRILSIDYYNYYANLRLSVALRRQGKLDLAMKIVLRMLKLYPADVAFLAQKGLILQDKGALGAADEAFSKVLALDSQNEIAKRFYIANKNLSPRTLK